VRRYPFPTNKGGYKVRLNEREFRLIISALENDKAGTWGDGRGEAIASLLNKIKRMKREATK